MGMVRQFWLAVNFRLFSSFMKVFLSRNTLPAAQHLHKINPGTIERVYIVDKSINSELGEQFLGECFFFFTVAEV